MYTIVNWLLTRRCNLSCNYCNIVKDYVTSPYKSVFEYKENSLSDNKKIIDHIMFINKNAFFILYGGEPTLYYELPELIDYMNEKNCNYTIISNMTGIVRKKIYDLLDNHNLKGLTFSLDPVVFDDTCTDKFRVTKSKNALNEITQIKHKYRNCDVVAEVTVDKQNCQYLEKLLKYLSEHNVYSDLTFIELQKSKWYDFSAVTNSDLIIEKNSNEYMMLKDLISRFNKEGYLVHFKEVFENALEFTNMKWTCNLKNNLLNNITIEPDGSLRLCLRIKGEFKNENFFKNVINGSINRKEIEEFKREMTKEYERKCLGCNWTCMMMGEMNNGNYKKITEHE